jgi:photosystem II stability/assembly factor-like uncharacterized protein
MKQHLKLAFLLLSMLGCSKEFPDQPRANVPPKTFLWLFPDSTLAEGKSKQHVRWWGEDQDGFVKGFLFTSGKLPPGRLRDTVGYRWRTANDTVIAFPLLVRQDTFDIAVRSADNTFLETLTENAMVRLSPSAYWDVNENGLYDQGDVPLPTLAGAIDTGSARLGMPVLNQPPTIAFAPNPNDPTVTMQQPETTFTTASFAWIGSDPDGDQTIASYEIALNDTNDASRRFVVSSNVRLVSLTVPRSRSDATTGVSDLDADVYAGTYGTSRRLLGVVHHLLTDTLNTFYVRARDIAGDVSAFRGLPDATHKWFVRRPRGRVLIVNDYIAPRSDTIPRFYANVLAAIGMPDAEVLDIGRGLSAEDKVANKPGIMVPPFIDPALINTLHLFDLVLWYSDLSPSLGVAQFPLFQYVRDGSHHGKVIYSTMFGTSNDPRGALTDFAPIDSVSSVDISSGHLLPTVGDNRIPPNYFVYPDSSDPAEIFPALQFNLGNPNAAYSVFWRPVYRRADAKYIYHMERDRRFDLKDPLRPPRYTYTPTLRVLHGVSSSGVDGWACGDDGVLLHTSDAGRSWGQQQSGAQNSLRAIEMRSSSTGWVVGENGTIIATSNGGATWTNRSVLTFADLLSVSFPTTSGGVVCGTGGILIRTTDGGTSWASPSFRTALTLRALSFADASVGVAVGDSGLIIKTTDAGASWRSVPRATPRQLNAVRFISGSTAFAVGTNGVVLRSVDAGETWTLATLATGELRSVSFADDQHGWICGLSGTILRTEDGGQSWLGQPTYVGQHLNGISAASSGAGWCVGTGGIVLGTSSGGAAWTSQPDLPLNVGVVDGPGVDGTRSFVFLGLPLHLLNGGGSAVKTFLERTIHEEFGL